MKYNIFWMHILLMLAIPTVASAMTDLGQVGEVYPVVEPDVRVEMQQKAVEGWEKKKKEYLEKVRTYQPFDLYPLPRAKEERSFAVDMSYTLDQDVKDKDGKILYPQGYTFNPLDYMRLSIGLVVIDGSDPAQIRWFKQSPYSSNHRVKLLLSGGYAQPLIPELNRAVFYLNKDIAERLQLTAVPCVAVQKDRHMQVTEFLIEEER
ncbi:hypothetical protein [Desulfogranum marinum]|uniref:hypothetical protein n=1 Tax=Desulfogranum marinum TaxID=453220 RepID=UPI001963B111|nr:hypothetical protein [Desulfogranum marinum]MBM9514067.1 hypothetical protein [Desulfogranum marinum]